MNCHECRYMMFDYIEHKLPGPAKLEVEKHLRACSACAEKFASLNEHRSEEEEKPPGLFWYLLKPSGGYKRFFFIGAIFTVIIVIVLISGRIKKLF